MKLNSKQVDNNYYFKFNIQLFADKDEKTEKPSEKRRKEAREKGQVLHSKEVNSVLVLLMAFVSLKLVSTYMYENISSYTRKVFLTYTVEKDFLIIDNFHALASEIIIVFLKIVTPILGIIVLAGVIACYMQVGFLFTTETLKPKLSKLNPIEGFKRLFSANAVMEAFKSLIKIIMVAVIGYLYITSEIDNIVLMLELDINQISAYLMKIVTDIAIRICLILIVLAFIDYIFQWRQHEKNLKMSKQEVKEEYKQVEGNPEIKRKIKQKQKEISMSRMMSDIPKADVIITNPTHFSIGIKYDLDSSNAPVVIAKGQDYIALRIREIAKENNIEIVENKPLARALYSSVEIGEEIPEEFFQAVAQVLAFVYELKGKTV